MSPSDPIGVAMHRALQQEVFPGAVLMVRRGGQMLYHQAFGLAARVPKPQSTTVDTVYDLASLTKPLATTTAVVRLLQEGRLGLNHRVADLLPELGGAPVGSVTVFHLLNHSSGLPAWIPLYQAIEARDREQPGFLGSASAKALMVQLIGEEALTAPVGTQSVYSDLGFILLGVIVERVSGQALDMFCRVRLYEPLQAAPLHFMLIGNGERLSSRATGDMPCVAATEDDPWRGRILRGEVHDENAFALGGVAGHAGLFGTAEAVLAVSRVWLDSVLGRHDFLSPDLAQQCVTRQGRAPGSSWALGWDTPSPPSSSGTRLSNRSFGHLGYTGTSLWVDPVQELEVVLLSNRVHPTRQNNRVQQFRPVIHDIIYEALIGD